METYSVDRFAGLDLLNDPQEVGASGAIDMLNLDLDRRGRIRTRDGWALVTSSAASSNFVSLGFYRTAAGVEWLIAGDSTTIRPYQSDGTAGTTKTAAATSNNAFAAFGNPSNTRLYAAAAGLFRFDGSAWATVTTPASSSPTLCAVTANDNRLAISDGSSRIYFSNVDDPETYTYAAGPPETGDFVDLWPGDGEGITGLIRWRDKLFAFKPSKFAVFTGTSTDATGGAIFNYYSVDANHGAFFNGCAVAGDEGVYFIDGIGDVYLTTGGDPVYLSAPIEPWLRGLNTTLPAIGAALPSLAYSNRRLYANYGGVQFVYDTQTRQWVCWQITASAMLGVRGRSGFETTIYLGDTATKKIGKISVNPAVTTDNGTAIAWRYQSGFYDLGVTAREKIVRWSRVTGTGTVTLARFADYGTTDSNSAALTLGTSPTADTTLHQKSWHGTLMSHKLSGTGAAMIASLSHDIRSVRPVGLRSA